MNNYIIEMYYKNNTNQSIEVDFEKIFFFQRIVDNVNVFRIENKNPIQNGRIIYSEMENSQLSKLILKFNNMEIFNSENFGEIISQKYFFGSYVEGSDVGGVGPFYEYLEITMGK